MKRTRRAGDEDSLERAPFDWRVLGSDTSKSFVCYFLAGGELVATAKGWKHECSRLLRAVPGQQVYSQPTLFGRRKANMTLL